jgi:hypothetical protein
MTDLMTIQGVQVPRIEYREQPVVTLRTVDRLHQRPMDTARKAFNYNKERFIKDEDYFLVPYAEWAKVQPSEIRTAEKSKQHNQIVFLTQSGYLMVVKSFNDDRAWRIQRELVNTYFAARKMIEAAREHQALPDVEGAIARAYQRGLKISDIMDQQKVTKFDLARYYNHRMTLGTEKEAAAMLGLPKDRIEAIEKALRSLGLPLPDPIPELRRKKMFIEQLNQALSSVGMKPSAALMEA